MAIKKVKVKVEDKPENKEEQEEYIPIGRPRDVAHQLAMMEAAKAKKK
jgi:hypothetical protein